MKDDKMFIEMSDDQGLVSLVQRSTWALLLAPGPPTHSSLLPLSLPEVPLS